MAIATNPTIATPIAVFVVGPLIPPGNGSVQAEGQVFDNQVLIGTGNGSTWNQKLRSPGGGDNLFIASIIALRPDTGEYVWHYQTTPGDTWDFDSAYEALLALPAGVAVGWRHALPRCARGR